MLHDYCTFIQKTVKFYWCPLKLKSGISTFVFLGQPMS